MKKPVLFIFRRDLRLIDNTALNAALKSEASVIPLFILDPRQVLDHRYRSIPGMQFLFESLRELNDELVKKDSRLHLLYGEAESVLHAILQTEPIAGVYFNRDYTPFSTKRDEALLEVCKQHGVPLYPYHDALLNEPNTTKKDDGKPYTVFTPFFKKNSKNPPSRPVTEKGSFGTLNTEHEREIQFLDELLPETNKNIFRKGGRREALSLIKNRVRSLTHYNIERDLPASSGTSGLSAHHKFGTCSIREVYWAAKESLPPDNRFIPELYWRDFFTTIGYFFPFVFERSFQKKFESLEWDNNPEAFKRWCDGTTGFPIVDAGMRELNETGFMQNRVRMIAASFLIKDLHINWQEGERYFARKLVDYDPAVNNGSWQWSASTGCDAQPYFRIFNPWLQQSRFDPNAEYIKKWIPELQGLSAKAIHAWVDSEVALNGYPTPMVEHSFEKQITEERYYALASLGTK